MYNGILVAFGFLSGLLGFIMFFFKLFSPRLKDAPKDAWGCLMFLLIGVGGLYTFSCGAYNFGRGTLSDVQSVAPAHQAVVQKLLRGEELPLTDSSLPVIYATFARDSGYSFETAYKIGDIRRYTIRFNTNDFPFNCNRKPPSGEISFQTN